MKTRASLKENGALGKQNPYIVSDPVKMLLGCNNTWPLFTHTLLTLSGLGCQIFRFIICYEEYDNTNYLTDIQQGVSKMPTMSACYSYHRIGIFYTLQLSSQLLVYQATNMYHPFLFRCPYYLRILLNLKVKCSKENICLQIYCHHILPITYCSDICYNTAKNDRKLL
jgi:hypothetical protein